MYSIYLSLLILLFSAFGLANNSQVSLSGATINDACHEFICHGPIPVNFSVYNSHDSLVIKSRSIEPSDGFYLIEKLASETDYYFVVDDSVFLYRKYPFKTLEGSKYSNQSRDFLVVPRADGIELLIHVSPFENNKYRIRNGVEYYLMEYIDLIKQNPDIRFEIHSYPDNDNDPSKNMILTLNRAVSLSEYFVRFGVSPNQLTYKPHESTDPKNPPFDFKVAKGKKYIGSTYLVVKLPD